MEGHDYLPLLGLALRGGRLAAGEAEAEAAVRAGRARLLVLARDAADRTRRSGERLSGAGACVLVTLPCGREELGRALGRSAAAIAAVTDTGLAAAVCARLARSDPDAYGQAAERLALKERRARERRGKRAADAPPHARGRPAKAGRNGNRSGAAKVRPSPEARPDRASQGKKSPSPRVGA